MEHSNKNIANLGADFSLDDLAKKCGYDLRTDSLKIRHSLEEHLERYYSHLQSRLNTTPKHLQAEQSALLAREVELKYGTQSQATLKSTLKSIKQYNADFDTTFYENESLKQIPTESLCKNAMDNWGELFESKIHAWQQKHIAKSQSEFVSQISEWIELMQRFDERLRAFGKGGELFGKDIMQNLREAFEDFTPLGDLEDLGDSNNLKDSSDFFNKFTKNRTNLHKSIANFAKYLELLESDSVKKLCDMLGSLYKAESKMQFERFATQNSFNTTIPTPYAKEEIIGVTLGRDLENILPQELALLDDEDFSILFDLKFAENRLFCFEKQGYEDISMIEEIYQEREKQTKDEKGPIILCIDTSGSMSGMPETIAKAIALFMAQRAMESKRKCYLISFSVGISTLDLTPPNGFFELMKFLEMSFGGGTDALPALKEGLTKMREEDYKNADLLMISDFVFSSRDLAKCKKLAEEKGDDNKCYALYVGNFGNNKSRKSSLFDKEFYYDGNTHSVEEIINTKNAL